MSFAHYLLQVNLYLIVFYVFYKLLLDKETYFTLNRIYLVSAGVLSLLIPFIRVEWLTGQKAAQRVYATVNWEAVLQKATIVTDNESNFNWGNLLAYIYCIGTIFFFLRLLFNLFALKKLINTTKSGVAFSFFSNKIIDKELPHVDVIDIHEEAHIKQWHTLDVLFFEILGIITWLNPVIYLYKKTIKNIHEFLADEMAADFQGDKAQYAILLLSKSFGISPNLLTNNFFDKSLIKKRIFMLQKERSKKIAVVKYGIFIPLFAIFIVFSSATVRKNKKLISIAEQIPMDKPIELVQNITNDTIIVNHAKQPATASIILKNTKLNTIKANKKLPDLISTDEEIDLKPEEGDKVFDFVSIEKQPEFPGGISKFYEYLSSSLKYPELAIKNNIQGKVFLSFIVEKNGALTDVKITRGLGGGTDEEAIRVIKESPKWNPALLNNIAVRVKYNINVNFKLDNDVPDTKKTSALLGKTIGLNVNEFQNSNTGKTPLIILDGVIQNQAELKNLDPKSIESISVLKDTRATTLYGIKGSNGVVIITSKTGKAGTFNKPEIQSLKSR